MLFGHPKIWIRIVYAAALLTLPASPGPTNTPTAAAEPLDYQALSHTLSIESLRAGSHDESGTNDYYFTLTMYALLNSADERNLDFEARKKISLDLGTFADTQLESLAFWTPDEKLKNFKETRIEGHGIRELTARAMRELEAKEADICVMVEITLYEKNKKFMFFGEDTLIAKTTYYPLPPTKFDTPLRTNTDLVLEDAQGLHAKLAVRYDSPAQAKPKVAADPE